MMNKKHLYSNDWKSNLHGKLQQRVGDGESSTVTW